MLVDNHMRCNLSRNVGKRLERIQAPMLPNEPSVRPNV